MQSVAAVRERLSAENWELRLKQAESYARMEAGWRRWRGGAGGVMPDGYDTNSVAAEALAGLFNGECRLRDEGYTDEHFEKELKRLVHNLVRRLHRRKERRISASEWEILPVEEEGTPRSVLDRMADPGQDAQERLAELEELKEEFEAFLQDPQLREVFRCLCSGLKGASGIAARLGIAQLEARKLRRRLAQRAAAFRQARRVADGR